MRSHSLIQPAPCQLHISQSSRFPSPCSLDKFLSSQP
ncbi:unnamed protein product [Spirodela intermedia]|uniref:Uncharacterized protein n=1 Tax=Spirodela intermedia TaxID=51605 RepID=A0A7I8JLN7_SPIIN|nr:unnamed protein product [Spirodela intermedia]CAA6671097.1 unnamed protein product [Spirodela intermedia]